MLRELSTAPPIPVPHSRRSPALIARALLAAAIAVAPLTASPAAAAEGRQSVTFGPIRVVAGTHLVIGGGVTGASPTTIHVISQSSDQIFTEEFFIIPPPPRNSNKTGVRGFGGDSSGIVGVAGSPGIMVTMTVLEGNLPDVAATVQLVDDETDRPIVVLAKPCQRCD